MAIELLLQSCGRESDCADLYYYVSVERKDDFSHLLSADDDNQVENNVVSRSDH